jgi:tetratricopeptide (TPR) repeat protein
MRSLDLWFLGYPDAALMDADQALKDAREIGQATSLMFALGIPLAMLVQCGNYATATKHCDELIALANDKGALYWKAVGILNQGNTLALTGGASDSLHAMISGFDAFRSAGSTVFMPFWLSYLARAYAVLRQFDDARRCISEAMKAIELGKGRLRPRPIVSRAKSRSNRRSQMQQRHKRISSTPCWSPANSKQSPGNSAPP